MYITYFGKNGATERKYSIKNQVEKKVETDVLYSKSTIGSQIKSNAKALQHKKIDPGPKLMQIFIGLRSIVNISISNVMLDPGPQLGGSQAVVVHLNFRAGLTFQVPVCTVPSSMDGTSWRNKVDAVILYASYRIDLLLIEGQRCVGLAHYLRQKRRK